MENQHRRISGYRELNEEEIAAMNEIKAKGAELGQLIMKMEETSLDVDKRWLAIGRTHLQEGLMALTRAIAKPTFFLWAVVFLAGCSSGLQERAFKDESGTYIVSRSLVNDRVTANQPHVSGVFACEGMWSSEEMAAWRQYRNIDMSWFTNCQPIEKYRPGAYQLTSDQPVGTIYKGPVEAAVLGAAVGTGLALSGTDVTQQGGGASANATAKSRGSRGHRR